MRLESISTQGLDDAFSLDALNLHTASARGSMRRFIEAAILQSSANKSSTSKAIAREAFNHTANFSGNQTHGSNGSLDEKVPYGITSPTSPLQSMNETIAEAISLVSSDATLESIGFTNKLIGVAIILVVSALAIMAVNRLMTVRVDDEDDMVENPPERVEPDVEETHVEKEPEEKHPVAYLAFGRVKDHVVLAQQSQGEEVAKEAEQTFQKLLKAAGRGDRIKPGEKNMLKAGSSKLYYYMDEKSKFMAVVAIADANYLDKDAYNCVNEFMGAARSQRDAETCQKGRMTEPLHGTMQELFAKYKNPHTNSKMGQALTKMENIKGQMTSNCQVVIESSKNLKALEKSSAHMDAVAKTFEGHTQAAKWKHQLERYKMYIIYGIYAFDIASITVVLFVL